jgi:flagellar basal-body rod protein FlgG
MFLSLDIAAGGLQAQQTNVDVISQNLANLSTTGYKRQIPEFTDLLYQDLRRVGATSSDTGTIIPTGIQLGLGVKTSAIHRDIQQGTLNNTTESLDLAINGRGYFQITLPDGTTAYTRDGTFQVSPTGEVVTADGFPLSPTITIPPTATAISINASGVVEATIPNQVNPSNLGTIELATFINENGLQATGSNLFMETQASSTPVTGNPGLDGVGTIQQGFLEESNVNPVTEITNLIVAQRAYEMNTKVITAADQMLQTLSQVG